jgi:hypothetical protein
MMLGIKINCPHCQQKLDVPAELLGQLIDCPACQGEIELPTLTLTDEAPSPMSIPVATTAVKIRRVLLDKKNSLQSPTSAMVSVSGEQNPKAPRRGTSIGRFVVAFLNDFVDVLSVLVIIGGIIVGIVVGWHFDRFGPLLGGIIGFLVSFLLTAITFGTMFILLGINNNLSNINRNIEKLVEKPDIRK